MVLSLSKNLLIFEKGHIELFLRADVKVLPTLEYYSVLAST